MLKISNEITNFETKTDVITYCYYMLLNLQLLSILNKNGANETEITNDLLKYNDIRKKVIGLSKHNYSNIWIPYMS